jgi:hypothetical protein
MNISWVRRKALKKINAKRYLIAGTAVSPVMLLSIVGIMILVGIYIVQYSIASRQYQTAPQPLQTDYYTR